MSVRPCTDCGEQIRLVEGAPGHFVPIDVHPSQSINAVVRVSDGRASVLGKVEAAIERDRGEPFYTSHYLTCAESSGYRRSRPYEGFMEIPRGRERQTRLEIR